MIAVIKIGFKRLLKSHRPQPLSDDAHGDCFPVIPSNDVPLVHERGNTL